MNALTYCCCFFRQIPRQFHTLLLRFCCGAWPSVRLSWERVLQLWWPPKKHGSTRLPLGSWNLGNSRKYLRHSLAINAGTRQEGLPVLSDKSGGVWSPDGHLPSNHRHKRRTVAKRVFQTWRRLEVRFRVPIGRRAVYVIQWSISPDADPHHFRQTLLHRVSLQPLATNLEEDLRLVCCHLDFRNRHLLLAGAGDGIFFRRKKWGLVLRAFISLSSTAVIRGQTSRLGVFCWHLHRL